MIKLTLLTLVVATGFAINSRKDPHGLFMSSEMPQDQKSGVSTLKIRSDNDSDDLDEKAKRIYVSHEKVFSEIKNDLEADKETLDQLKQKTHDKSTNFFEATSSAQDTSTRSDSVDVAGACLSASLSVLPAAFCWKKDLDLGSAVAGPCSSGYNLWGGKCYKDCPSNYDFLPSWLGAKCYKDCRSGYKNNGAYGCKSKRRYWYGRRYHSKDSKTASSTGLKWTCPDGKYQAGLLCYRDCGTAGMVNCGTGACALS